MKLLMTLLPIALFSGCCTMCPPKTVYVDRLVEVKVPVMQECIKPKVQVDKNATAAVKMVVIKKYVQDSIEARK